MTMAKRTEATVVEEGIGRLDLTQITTSIGLCNNCSCSFYSTCIFGGVVELLRCFVLLP